MAFAFFLGFLVGRQSTASKPTEKTIYRNISQGDRERILALLRAGNKIEAIKLYRSIHQTGLKEAKDTVERLKSEI